MISNQDKNKTFIYFQIFIVIFFSVSPLISTKVSVTTVILMIIINLLRIAILNQKIPISRAFCIALVILCFGAFLDLRTVLSGYSYNMRNIWYIAIIVYGYLISIQLRAKDFFHIFEIIVFWGAILSLVGMSVYYINPALIQTFPTYMMNGKSHHTLLFFNYLFVGNWASVRNCGFAWEPGLFQLLLNMAMCISIKENYGKKLLIRNIIYVLAIVLTRSTMGFILLLINCIFLIRKDKKYIFLIMIVILTFATSIAIEFQYQLEFKLGSSEAFEARYTPMLNAYKYYWMHPFGIGLSAYSSAYSSGVNIGSFDGYSQLFMGYGYPALLFLIYRFMAMIKTEYAQMAIIFFIGLFSEPIHISLLAATMYFICEKDSILYYDNN